MAKGTGIPRLHKKHNVWYWAGQVDGKKRWVRLSDDYQRALYKYAEIEGNRSKNEYLVSSAINRFNAQILPNNKPKTQEDRRFMLKKLRAVFGHMRLADVTTPMIQQYLEIADKKISANRHIKLLSQVFRHAILWGLCKNNPCQSVKYHKEKPRERYITDIELEKLKQAAEPMYRAIIEIAYITGMRRSDLLDLELRNLTEEGIYNCQNKTGGKQLYKWSSELKKAVKLAKTARKERNFKYLFTSRHGQKISVTAFNSAFQRLRKRAGLHNSNLHFHDIRHKTATDAKRLKGIQYAQQLLGHESETMTIEYIAQVDTIAVDPLR